MLMPLIPMIKLTLAALRVDPSNTYMVFFNKTEDDMQWKDQLDRLETNEHSTGRFSVAHILL